MPVRRRDTLWLIPATLCLALTTAGCEEKRHVVGEKPAPGPRQKEEDTFIVGKKTMEVVNAAPELQKGEAQVASQKITARDPITLPGNAYVSIIGRNSILNITHAIDLYQAENGRYPKDYQEFMDVIIKGNNIALPALPSYQKYGYDEKAHKLIILEYPH